MMTLNATDVRKEWSSAPNRKKHIPYTFKALIIDDVEKLGESIICQDGKN